MPARHYRVEYTEDDNNYTLLAADEAPGPGRTQPLTGLAAGTHTGKLRLTPLSGDPAPVLSNSFTFQVGTVPLVDPVAATATATVTIADVMTMRDNLLATIGVTASVTDYQPGATVEPLAAAVSVQATATDSQTMVERPTAAATATATIADVRAMLESVLAAATATATAADTYTAGGAGGTISENFDTAIATTYASFVNMAGTNTVQGWTVGSSGYDPMTVGGSASFYGARITTATGGYAGNKLDMYGAYSEDAESNLLARSGFKLTRTWTGSFSAGTLTLKYQVAAGSPVMTIKANGVSAGTLTYNAAWQTATITLSAAQLSANGGNITLEVECAPASDPTVAPVISLDSITYG